MHPDSVKQVETIHEISQKTGLSVQAIEQRIEQLKRVREQPADLGLLRDANALVERKKKNERLSRLCHAVHLAGRQGGCLSAKQHKKYVEEV